MLSENSHYWKGSDSMNEIWKDLKYKTNDEELDLTPYYQVSNLGNIRSFYDNNGSKCEGRLTNSPRILKTSKAKNGYLRVGLRVGERQKIFLVHRLVALVFNPIPNSSGMQVNHINENKEDNALANLEWTTPKENTNHGSRTDRAIENMRKTKATEEWKQNNSKGNVHNARAVVGVNIKTGETIEFESMSCVNEFFNKKNADRSISATIRGKQKSAYGYRWFYKD